MTFSMTTARRAAAMVSCVLSLAAPLPALAQSEGTVQLPLTTWQALATSPSARAQVASLGVANVQVRVEERDGRIVAMATASMTVRAPAEGAEALLLPSGTAIESATADGAEIALVHTANGLAWIAESAGQHRLVLEYELEGVRYDQGASVSLPLPPAPSVHVTASLPPEASDGAMVPGIGIRSTREGDLPSLEATIPGGTATQIAWRSVSASESAAPSRATYHGVLGTDAVRFDVELAVDLSSDSPVPIALFPTDVALGSVTVDGTDAPIRVVNDRFAAIVSGHGRHLIRASIEIPLDENGGLPSALVSIPEVPVSRFEIELPDDKDLRVTPLVAISRERARSLAGVRGAMVAVFHVPLTDTVHLEWPEALPDEATTAPGEVEVRASATLVHVLSAEEGLLRGTVHAAWDVAHGAAARFDLTLPTGVDVGQVTVDVATVADWRVSGEGDARVLSVFLDREVQGAVQMAIEFEVLRSSSPGATSDVAHPFDVPLLTARDVWRQSGMLALLATHDLVLEPEATEDAARVGENQLPAEVRAEIDATIAHVFRWTDAPPHLSATAIARPHEAGRFDARIDTLVSLGDVTTTASAAVDVHIKSGSLSELSIALPPGASVLEVSAPSLREHRVEDVDGHPTVHMWFTQEMEGDLRVELRWERIASANETDVTAPMAHVDGVDVEQGRIAIEATAAVEVAAREAEGLSPMDLSELPEELVLRSTNPILLAFRYAHATPAPTLALSVARHQEVTLRNASIDEAHYTTLVTDDGLAVTTAMWTVRNDGAQFLRITLPDGAEVWSARVGGQPETPALASDAEGDAPVILLGVLRSTEPFAVELTYATPVSHMGLLGRLHVPLARPDLVVSHAQWDVYLPADARWSTPSSDLALYDEGGIVSGSIAAFSTPSGGGPAIRVPTEAMRFVFDDVYVGRDGGAVSASFPYASGWGVGIGWMLGLFGAFLGWLGLLGLVMARAGFVLVPEGGPFELATYRFASAARQVAVTKRGVLALSLTLTAGVGLVALALFWFGASPVGPALSSAVVVLGLGVSLRKKIAASITTLRARVAPPPPADTYTSSTPEATSVAPMPLPIVPPAPPSEQPPAE
jgi:hypothetical protein